MEQDVVIKYRGDVIGALTDSGTMTLETQGTYCEGNILVEYTDREKPTQEKSATPSEVSQEIVPDSGYVLSKVTIEAIPDDYVKPTGTTTITENGTYDVTGYAAAEVSVVSDTHRRYVITNPSDVSGTGNCFTAITGDPLLASIRDKQSLVVMYTTSGTVSCISSGIAANELSKLPIVGTTTYYQSFCRLSDAGEVSLYGVAYAINHDTSVSSGNGRVHITSDGDLILYANSNAYAIPAGTIYIDVLWGED